MDSVHKITFLSVLISRGLPSICVLVLASLAASAAADEPSSEYDRFRELEARLSQQAAELNELRASLGLSEGDDSPTSQVFEPASLEVMVPPSPEPSLSAEIEELRGRLNKLTSEAAKKAEADSKKPTVKPRFRLHTDVGWYSQDELNRESVGDIQDGAYLRRARLGFDAKAFGNTEYRLDFEMGSGGGRPSIFDAYGRITNLPGIGNVQIGHFREPFSLEALTSSNWYTFLERGLPNAFDPSRNWGIMTYNCGEEENFTYAIGVFRDGSDNFGDDIGDSGEWAMTTRVTFLPYFEEHADNTLDFLHTGFSYSYRDPDKLLDDPAQPTLVSYNSRPESGIREDGVGGVPPFIRTGNIPDASQVQLGGADVAWIRGPFSLQAEYAGSWVSRSQHEDSWFHGAYVYASYFLTGESRQYNRKIGMFDINKIHRVFRPLAKDGEECGWGAWEVALRWSYLDLSSGDVNGGYLDDTTVGVNWYLNSNFRIMFNAISSDLHDPTYGRSNEVSSTFRLDVFY